MKRILIFSIINFYLLISIHSQDRNVMWVHGLGGSANSWLTNAQHHQEMYKMKCGKADYPKGSGTNDCSNDVKDEFNKFFPNQENEKSNILVSHSFGGLVSRNLEMQNSKNGVKQNFGGQILVHSPQGGAQFAANFKSGLFLTKFTEIWDKISNPIKKDKLDEIEVKVFEKINNLTHTIHISDLNLLLKILFGLNTISSDEFPPFLQSQIEMLDFYDPVKINDLDPSSKIINELNNFDSPGNLVTVWGAEEHNIFFRLISSLLVKPGSAKLDIVSDENHLFESFEKLYRFNGNIDRALGIVSDLSLTSLFSNVFVGNSSRFHDRANSWFAGADYINSGLETDWLITIGAIEYKTITASYNELTSSCEQKLEALYALLEEFHVTGEFKNIREVQDAIGELRSNPSCYKTGYYTKQVPVKKASDGLVLAESQQAAGGILFENINCNHFEALNTKVMSDNFLRIFNFGENGSEWFVTKNR